MSDPQQVPVAPSRPVTVRRGTPRDAAAVSKICDELRAHVGDPTGNLSVEAILRDGFGDRPEFELMVAERDGQVIGYALFHESYEPAFAARGLYMADLAVTAAARGSGAGRALVDGVSAEARQRDRAFVSWLSNPANATALAFYRHIGVDAVVPCVAHVRVFSPPPGYGSAPPRRES